MKKAFVLLLSALLLVGMVPMFSSAATIVDYGTCGDNMTWTLDSDGTLTVSGMGVMNDYFPASS